MAPEEFRGLLADLLGADTRPVVAYTAVWPVAKAFSVPPRTLPGLILDVLLDVAGPERTVLMPTFTNGFKNGLIDLDHEPGHTGMINNLLRGNPSARRSLSAFFSFVAHGPEAAEVSNLCPADAWGEGSLYEWIEDHDAHVMVIGVPWTYCSFLHRAEWVARVPYRYPKIFSGEVIRDGRRTPLKETLYVRSLDPPALNAWPGLDILLARQGMRSHPLGHSQVAEIGARALMATLMAVIRKNPYAFVRTEKVASEHHV